MCEARLHTIKKLRVYSASEFLFFELRLKNILTIVIAVYFWVNQYKSVKNGINLFS